MNGLTWLGFNLSSVFKRTICFVFAKSYDLDIFFGQVIVDEFLVGNLFAGRSRLEHVVTCQGSNQSSGGPLLIVWLIGSTTATATRVPQILHIRVEWCFVGLIILCWLFVVVLRVTLLSLFLFVLLLWLFILGFWGIILALAWFF